MARCAGGVLRAPARDKAFLKRTIEDPSVGYPASTMPGCKGQLTELQIEDLARYPASLR